MSFLAAWHFGHKARFESVALHMAYRLQREDGNIVRKFKLIEHNKPTSEAELWWYGFGKPNKASNEYIVWYKHEGKWKILIAGPEAYRRYGE